MKQTFHVRKWSQKFMILLGIISFFLLMAFSGDVPSYAEAGLKLWAYSVVPVLFPFIILSKFWIYCQIPENLIYRSGMVFKNNVSLAVTLPLMLLGLGSGFPVGAVFVRHFYENGTLSKRTAEDLLPLCSFVSPMFLKGYVRSLLEGGLSGSAASPLQTLSDTLSAGYPGINKQWHIMLICLYAPLLLLYVIQILRKTRKESSDSPGIYDIRSVSGKPDRSRLTIREIWISSLEIIFTIGIYMMLFSILLGLSGHISAFRSLPARILLSNLEVTTGCQYIITYSFENVTLKMITLLALLEFGGICTLAQTGSVISGTGLSMNSYIRTKLVAVLLSICLYLILSLTAQPVPFDYSAASSFFAKSSLLREALLLYPS